MTAAMKGATIVILAMLLAGGLAWIELATKTPVDGATPVRAQRQSAPPGEPRMTSVALPETALESVDPQTTPSGREALESPLSAAEREHDAQIGRPLLVGRLLAADGAPYAHQILQAVVLIRGESHIGSTTRVVRTDSTGRVVVRMPKRVGLELEGTVRFLEPGAEGHQSGALVRVPDPLVPGENNVGEVRLVPAPVVAAGQVVGPEGRGIGGLTVHVKARGEPDERGRPTWSADPHLVAQFTGPEGEFAILGWASASEYRAFAAGPGVRRVEPVTFVPGDRSVVLMVRQSVVVRGSVLLDPDVPDSLLEVLLRVAGGPWRGGPCVVREGKFEATAVEPGAYDVAVVTRFGGEPVHVVPGLVLEPGLQEDPRLQRIDLRGKLTVFELRITGRDRRPVARTLVRTPGGEDPGRLPRAGDNARLGLTTRSGFATDEGIFRFIIAGKPIGSVVVGAPGHREVELHDVASDREVRLAAHLEVVLQLPGSITLPAEHWLAVTLPRAGEWVPTPEKREPEIFGVDGRARVMLSGPGGHTVRLHCGKGEVAPGPRTRFVDSFELQDVRDAADQVLTIPVTQARIDKALRRL